MAITYSEDGSVKKRKGNKKALALNAGPSTPIKYDPHMRKYMPNLGAGRVNDDKIRSKIKIPRA
tara:strand:+ start:284 stop:475 length:192 start_codon:yes stop_codon:yes gene_type:complete